MQIVIIDMIIQINFDKRSYWQSFTLSPTYTHWVIIYYHCNLPCIMIINMLINTVYVLIGNYKGNITVMIKNLNN